MGCFKFRYDLEKLDKKILNLLEEWKRLYPQFKLEENELNIVKCGNRGKIPECPLDCPALELSDNSFDKIF